MTSEPTNSETPPAPTARARQRLTEVQTTLAELRAARQAYEDLILKERTERSASLDHVLGQLTALLGPGASVTKTTQP